MPTCSPAHFQYYPGLDLAGQRGRIVEVDVGGDDRELQRVDEGCQHFITFIKLVATERHGIIAEQVHDLRVVPDPATGCGRGFR